MNNWYCNISIIFYYMAYTLLVIYMIVKCNDKEKSLLARLMRAEAKGEGNLGMLMVGNVGLNRVIVKCLSFKNIRTITEMVFQSPGGFSGIKSPLFYGNPTKNELNLVNRVLRGEYYHPATNALWFYACNKNEVCSSTWWNQKYAGKYKNHCFYEPEKGVCNEIRP